MDGAASGEVGTKVLLLEEGEKLGNWARALRQRGVDPRVLRRGDPRVRRGVVWADAVVLGLGIPDFAGISLCRALRSAFAVPIIALTVRSVFDERERSMRAGADRCVFEPCTVADLMCQIGMARALAHSRPPLTSTVRRGDFCIDVTRPRVSVGGVPVLLTRKEYELLALICAANGAVCRRSLLIGEVWGPHLSGMDNTLNVHVASLRAKLLRSGLIETVRGVGYRLGERPDMPDALVGASAGNMIGLRR